MSACHKCGVRVGRDGRTDDEMLQALSDGSLRTAFGVFDWSTHPPTEYTYCKPCFIEAKDAGELPRFYWPNEAMLERGFTAAPTWMRPTS